MPLRNPPSTPQALQNGMNIIIRNTPTDIITVDFDSITKNARKMVDAVDAANAAKNPPEEGWRQELEELDRRLLNQMTVDEAELYANNEANKYKAAVREVEGQIATLQDVLKTPGLSQCQQLREGREVTNAGCRCDVCLFTRKIERVTLRLAPLKAKQQQSIRSCSGIILAAKELKPLRKRWEELKACVEGFTVACEEGRYGKK